jgi:pimeloyl-ACP methyl ester carboxylesterase
MASPCCWQSSGITLSGESAGPSSAPTVVLLHGGGQTRHAWASAVRHLASLGYRAISYDARGHGDSTWASDGNYAIGALAGDLRTIVSGIDGPVALVGASMGGLTAFYALGGSALPQTRALVMVDVVLRPDRAGSERVRRFMTANPDGFASLEEVADAIASYNPHRPRPRNLSGLLKNVRLGADGRYRWHWDPAFLGGSWDIDGREQLLSAVSSQITVPTLVLRGEHSDVVGDDGVESMRRLMPQVVVEDIHGAGHMIAGDSNSTFLTAIARFLDRHLPVP